MTAHAPRRDVGDWPPRSSVSGQHVETLELRPGMLLVKSAFDGGPGLDFHFVEPEDVFGIGFHIKGGSRFDMDRCRFLTQPLDVWAGTSPRSAPSSFTLSSHGFRTVSLRFDPDVIQELLQQYGQQRGRIMDMAHHARDEVAVARLPSIDPAAARLVEAMFVTRYTGTARTLFLESCALGLLAAQIDATTLEQRPTASATERSLTRKLEAARAHLDEHFARPPTIRSLARIVGTNEFALKRGFKEAFGSTIFGYVRQRRMEHAVAELHDGRSVETTARSAGYDCPRSFADAFRRHFGVLPSAVSRRVRAAIPTQRNLIQPRKCGEYPR